jgi:hypothetical protein
MSHHFTRTRGVGDPARARHAYPYTIRITVAETGVWYEATGTMRADRPLTARQIKQRAINDLVAEANTEYRAGITASTVVSLDFTITR